MTSDRPDTGTENLAPGTAPETSVGATLARARAELGWSVADVAQQLKFAPRQIEALEAERYEALPGSTFARGMVRSYARLLKLDAGPLLAALEGRFDVPDANRLAARFREPVPFSDGARRSNVIYAVLSLGVLAVAAVMLYEWRQERASVARLTFVPAAKAPLEPPRAAVASAAPTPVPVMVLQPEAAEAKAPAAAPAGSRIVIRCERESWIEIRDRTGRTLLSELNPAGTERVVEGEPPFSLVIGNAQHVHMTYNGEPVDLKPYVKVEVARFTLP
jgi:cytoskeleton protein RodZ